MSKAEYVTVSYTTREAVWIRKFLNKLMSEQIIRKIKMLGDNEMSFMLTKDPESQNHVNYIHVIHHHI